MKKILVLILLGVITILTPLSFKANYYSIDQPVIDLNNHTLNEVFTETINELDQYKIETNILDLQIYEGLSLRDIFETCNLITNGDFALDSNADGLADNWTKGGGATFTPSLETNTQKMLATSKSSLIILQRLVMTSGHDYYVSFDFERYFTTTYAFALGVRYASDYTQVYGTTTNQSINHSLLFTPTSNTAQVYFGTIAEMNINDYFKVGNLFIVDTSIFTTAPSQLQLDEWLSFYLDPSTIASFDMVGDIQVYRVGNTFYNLTEMMNDKVYSTFNLDTFDNLTNGEITDQFGAWQTLGIEDIEVLSLTDFQTFAPALDQEDMLYWFNYYNLILEYDEVQANILSDLEITILIIALVLFIIGIALAIYFHHKIMFFVTGLLWFVPIVIVPNIFIITFSVIMIIIFGLLAFYNSQGKDFD